MADNKIDIDESSTDNGVKDHVYYLYEIQRIMAELTEKYKDELLSSKAAKVIPGKGMSEKIIDDLSRMAENVKLEEDAESTGSDAKGTVTEKVKAVDVNVKEKTTPMESDSDAKGSATGEKAAATMDAFKKTDEKESEKDSVAEPCKEADKEDESKLN